MFFRGLLFVCRASEAREQSERAKLSGACSGFLLLTHAFAGVPLLSSLLHSFALPFVLLLARDLLSRCCMLQRL